jgi:hypothetical protein
LLTDPDVEREYRLSQARLRKSRVLIARGERNAGPPYLKYGRSVFYVRSTLESWLAAHEVGAKS